MNPIQRTERQPMDAKTMASKMLIWGEMKEELDGLASEGIPARWG